MYASRNARPRQARGLGDASAAIPYTYQYQGYTFTRNAQPASATDVWDGYGYITPIALTAGELQTIASTHVLPGWGTGNGIKIPIYSPAPPAGTVGSSAQPAAGSSSSSTTVPTQQRQVAVSAAQPAIAQTIATPSNLRTDDAGPVRHAYDPTPAEISAGFNMQASAVAAPAGSSAFDWLNQHPLLALAGAGALVWGFSK